MLRGALFGFLILSPMLALALAGRAGLRFNDTQSFPVEIDWASAKHPEKGDLVSFRPPALSGFDLARGRGYLDQGECRLKRIVAAGGDTASIGAAECALTASSYRTPSPALPGRPCGPSDARLPPARLPAPAWRGPGEVLVRLDNDLHAAESTDGR